MVQLYPLAGPWGVFCVRARRGWRCVSIRKSLWPDFSLLLRFGHRFAQIHTDHGVGSADPRLGLDLSLKYQEGPRNEQDGGRKRGVQASKIPCRHSPLSDG